MAARFDRPHVARMKAAPSPEPNRVEHTRFRALGVLGLLTGAVALVAAAGASVTSGGRGRWYRDLKKPPFQPPPAAFGPVWTGLYGLMVWSAFRIWRKPVETEEQGRMRTRALRLWAAQLVLNGAWSPLFFGAHRPRAALVDIALLVPTLAAYTHSAAKIDRGAALMMAPYLAWASFATLLNIEIVRRNPKA